MKESLAAKKARTLQLIERLKRYYPDAHCALDHGNALELLVATVLSAQCTDVRVNLVTPDLFRRYRRAADYAGAALPDLEALIRPTGFFRSKAKSLKGLGEKLVELYDGQVPQTLGDLTSLPGVGRKTANVVLGNAFGIASGIVVDTHVKRLSFRLGLTAQKAPERVEADLLKLVPEKHWIDFSHWLIFHGRQICKARKPQCEICPLEGDCPRRGLTARR